MAMLRVLSSKLRRTPPATDRKTGNVADNPSFANFACGSGRRTGPLLPAPRVILGRQRHLRACV